MPGNKDPYTYDPTVEPKERLARVCLTCLVLSWVILAGGVYYARYHW